jgi:hypothetical protein
MTVSIILTTAGAIPTVGAILLVIRNWPHRYNLKIESRVDVLPRDIPAAKIQRVVNSPYRPGDRPGPNLGERASR